MQEQLYTAAIGEYADMSESRA
ncbi:hypothetical protein [Nitrosospira sp. Nsp14]|nr:hypothetical protein [Nitrosospira sp. Nsp14]